MPKPERCVGFESLGGGDGEAMFLGLWLRLRDSSRIARAFPSLVGGDDCMSKLLGCGGQLVEGRVAW